jgi:hypothetical protein
MSNQLSSFSLPVKTKTDSSESDSSDSSKESAQMGKMHTLSHTCYFLTKISVSYFSDEYLCLDQILILNSKSQTAAFCWVNSLPSSKGRIFGNKRYRMQ